MARRYVGHVSIEIDYTGNARDEYRCTLRTRTRDDGPVVLAKSVVTVSAPASGFGPGVAYDSPEAFDSVARAALAFAADDAPGGIWARELESATREDCTVDVRRSSGREKGT